MQVLFLGDPDIPSVSDKTIVRISLNSRKSLKGRKEVFTRDFYLEDEIDKGSKSPMESISEVFITEHPDKRYFVSFCTTFCHA